MRVLIAGASGGIGTRLVKLLRDRHEVVPASRSSGIDTVTGDGVAAAMRGVQAVIDVTNIRSREPHEVRRFFESSARNLTLRGRDAGVQHHITLSVVGADRMPGSAYMPGKVAQERAVIESGVPYSILRATQFFEFVAGFADVFASERGVCVPDANMQPIASDDVANAIARLIERSPANAILEVGGPEVMPIRHAVSRIMETRDDARVVTSAQGVTYFGASIEQDTLVPGPAAIRGSLSLEDWLSRSP
jgi:uncharacterized protein YbjT (DUF2867 family)